MHAGGTTATQGGLGVKDARPVHKAGTKARSSPFSEMGTKHASQEQNSLM